MTAVRSDVLRSHVTVYGPVVDPERVNSAVKDVNFVETGRNLGYAGGINVGRELAGACDSFRSPGSEVDERPIGSTRGGNVSDYFDVSLERSGSKSYELDGLLGEDARDASCRGTTSRIEKYGGGRTGRRLVLRMGVGTLTATAVAEREIGPQAAPGEDDAREARKARALQE